MNIPDSINKITREFAHQAAEWEASATYAYLMMQAKELKKQGEDLTKYEIIFVTNDHPVQTKDGFRVQKTIRLHRINTPL